MKKLAVDFTRPFPGKKPGDPLTPDEIVSAVRLALSAEEEATSLYNQIADYTRDDLVAPLMRDIASEEQVHAGELQELLNKLVENEFDMKSKGQREASQKLNKASMAKGAESMLKNASARSKLKTVGHLGSAAVAGAAGLHAIQALLAKRKRRLEKKAADAISLDVPLFIRMLEWAKEDAKTDMQLHRATENLLSMGTKTHDMTVYPKAVSGPSMPPLPPGESKTAAFLSAFVDELQKLGYNGVGTATIRPGSPESKALRKGLKAHGVKMAKQPGILTRATHALKGMTRSKPNTAPASRPTTDKERAEAISRALGGSLSSIPSLPKVAAMAGPPTLAKLRRAYPKRKAVVADPKAIAAAVPGSRPPGEGALAKAATLGGRTTYLLKRLAAPIRQFMAAAKGQQALDEKDLRRAIRYGSVKAGLGPSFGREPKKAKKLIESLRPKAS